MEDKTQSTYDIYCQVSSCLGVIDFYYAKHVLEKIFWATVLLVGLGVTVWQTEGVFNQFLSGPRFQTTFSGHDKNDFGGIYFPNITICNFNRAKQSLINATQLNPKVLTYMFSLFGVTYDFPLNTIESDISFEDYENAYQKFIENNSHFTDHNEFFNFYGHQFNDTFIYLRMGEVPPWNISRMAVYTPYGLCWKLIPNIKLQYCGSTDGLKMFIDPLVEEYMTHVVQNNYLSEGILLAIDYVFEPLIPLPYLIAPGFSAEIMLSASRYITTIPEFALFEPDCQKNTTLTLLNEEYSPYNCLFDCYLKMLLRKCGCVSLVITKQNHSICNMTTMYNCGSKPPEDIIIKTFTDCTSQCKPPCTDYNSVSAAITNAKAMSRQLQPYFQSQNIRQPRSDLSVNNFISVSIYFATPEISVIETTEAMPLFTFISNIGGQLGLWTGISIMTLIQFLYYMVIACFRGDLCFYRSNYCLKSTKSSKIERVHRRRK